LGNGLVYYFLPNFEPSVLNTTIYEIISIWLYVGILINLKILLTSKFGQEQLIPYFSWIIRLEIIIAFSNIVGKFISDWYLIQIAWILTIVVAVPYIVIFVKIIKLKDHKLLLLRLRQFMYLTIIISFIAGTLNAIGEFSFWYRYLYGTVAYFIYIIPMIFLVLFYHRINAEYNNIFIEETPAANSK